MILVCGEALIDFSPVQLGEETGYVARPGGSPYNVAVGLARLGVPTEYLGKLSNDPFGQRLLANLERNGVGRDYVLTSHDPTTLAFVHPDVGNEPGFSFYNTGAADRNLYPADLPDELPESVTAIHVGSVSLLLEPSASTLFSLLMRERARRVVSFDPNVRPFVLPDRLAYGKRVEQIVEMSSIVKVSKADLEWLYPGTAVDEIAARYLESGPQLVVVTLGCEGAMGFASGMKVEIGPMRVCVADTVGAGDAFMAGLLAHLHRADLITITRLRDLTVEAISDALRFANKCGALACTRRGADPPSLGDLDAFGL